MKRQVLVVAAILGSGFLWYNGSGETDPGIDMVQTAALAATPKRDFSIANLESRTSCEASRGAAKTGRSRSFEPNSGCADVWPGLAEARNWTENEDGSVILSKGNGEAVLTFAPGDGVDYEALDPQDAIVTVTRLR